MKYWDTEEEIPVVKKTKTKKVKEPTKTKDTVNAEALTAIGNRHRCGVALSMGTGKTLLGLRHMQQNLTSISRFLVVAPKLSVYKSWMEDAEKFGLLHLMEQITFTTYLSLTKQDLDYDVVYLDECHNLLEKHIPWLSKYENKILGLTGTPPKYKHSKRAQIIEKYCPIIHAYTTDTAIEDKILNDYIIIMHPLILDSNRNISMTKGERSWFTSEAVSYDYWDKKVEAEIGTPKERIARIMRMKSLMSAESKVRYAKRLFEKIKDKAIVFANTTDQADRLCAHSYHSKNPNSEANLQKFKSGEILKMSTVLQLNEGTNIKNLKEAIILHAYGNERKAAQRIGRLLRLNPDEKATIHILYYKDTVDEIWTKQALEDLDQTKIIWN
jgi:superfamily II DNA or RNA helicase